MAALGEAATQCLNHYNPSHSPGVSHEDSSPGNAHYDQEIILHTQMIIKIKFTFFNLNQFYSGSSSVLG